VCSSSRASDAPGGAPSARAARDASPKRNELAHSFPEAASSPESPRAECDTRTPQPESAAYEIPAGGVTPCLRSPRRGLAALDGVQDPGNVGTIWRTADAAGLQGLLLGEGAGRVQPKVQRAAWARAPQPGDPAERSRGAKVAAGAGIQVNASALDG
jgi:hypothetical protein